MAKREIPEINAGSMADIAFLLLIFFLVTTTMDKDTAYKRQIPKLIDVPITEIVKVEERNICAIKANDRNQLMFRGKMMQNPDEISEKIVEFFRMNEGLTPTESKVKIADPTYRGHNFPFYSSITKKELEEAVETAEKEFEAAEDMNGATQEFIDFKLKTLTTWEEKQSALRLYGRNSLPEIHFQAHIRVEVMSNTQYELFAKIQSEIEEAIYELRDDAAEEIFNESYGIIKSRRAMDKEDEAKDQRKLDLLKILYPDRIIEVKPK